jgi:protein-S-isoprenylcysteine O-methyltransferase Ste14
MLYRQLIAWPWLIWALYWVLAALRTKRTRRREPFLARLTHVLPLLVGGLLVGGQELPWGPLAARLWPPSPVAYGVGLALLLAGLALAVWARVYLGGNWSGSVTVKEAHELIRSGPYALVRHPIYTGLIAAVLGTALASGTVHAALGLAIIAASLMRKLRAEEGFMRETFPGEYARYSAEVPALVPFTGSLRSARR